MSLPIWKTVLIAGGSAILCGVAYKILKRIGKQSESVINELLIYGSETDENRNKQAGSDNLLCIYYVIVHASRSIDVCMPSLRSDTIAKCLLNVHEKSHVRIRVVVHKAEHFDQILMLADHGIEVKLGDSTWNLRYEFILVDAAEIPAMALIGSLDYDFKRVNCNSDMTLLTSDGDVVRTLKKEFDRIWHSVVYYIDNDVESADI